MISLDQVSEAIKALQTQSATSDINLVDLRQKIKDLFFSLFQEDTFYVIAINNENTIKSIEDRIFFPYVAPAGKNSAKKYLRIFSHKEAAIKFAETVSLSEQNVVYLTSVETVQLAKYWLLHGVTGYMLNDGYPWVTISFADYLSMVFSDLLNRPDMCNEEYIALSDFVLSYYNGANFIYEQLSEENSVQETIVFREIDKDSSFDQLILTGEVLHQFISEDLTISIEMKEICLSVLSSHLKWILNEMKPYDSDSEKQHPFKEVRFVNLDYLPSKNDDLLQNASKTKALVYMPNQEKKSKWDQWKEKFSKLKNILTEKTGKIFNKIKQSPNADSPCGESEKNGNSDNKESVVTIWQNVLQKSMIGISWVLILCCLYFVFETAIFSNFDQFETAINNGELEKASVIYQENQAKKNFVEKVEKFLPEAIDQSIAEFAANEITLEEIQLRMAAYQEYPSLQDNIQNADVKITTLEKSKQSYIMGEKAYKNEDYLEALYDWQQVLPEDGYYILAQQVVNDNADKLVLEGLIDCHQYKEEGDLEKYEKGINTLYYWFPENKQVIEAYLEKDTTEIDSSKENFQSEKNPLDPFYVPSQTTGQQNEDIIENPIRISNIAVKKNEQQSTTLYIEWVNTSGKEIQQITFSVEPYDDAGYTLACLKNGYIQYDAIAVGPFTDGEGMDTSRYWTNVWYNSMISGVRLLKVSITYTDGTTQEVSDLTDIIQKEAF